MRRAIVKFSDGSFALRRGLWFYQYLDLVSPSFWWSMNSKFFADCLGTEDQVRKAANLRDLKTVDVKWL
jgi:hypothetical protein